MFLEEISNPTTIVEASEDYGRKLYFDYRKTEKGKDLLSSPSPIVLYLGTWRMTDKQGNKKKFICGLNLAYLNDEEELSAVQNALPDILKTKNMKSRYRIGSTLLPDIFRRAYRTYNANNLVTRPIRGRLHALKTSSQDKENAKEIASKDGREWGDLENQDKNQYIDQALRKRGSEDVKRQEKSKKEREQIDRYVEPKKLPEKPEPAPEDELEKAPEELPKPIEPPTAPAPKPSKPAAPKPIEPPTPEPRKFKPIELGPGYEKPVVDPNIASPLQSVPSSMVTPHRIKIKKPRPDEPEVVEREPDGRLP